MTKRFQASLMLGLAGCSYGLFLTLMKIANMNGYMRDDLMVGQYLSAAVVLGIVVLFRYRVKVRFSQMLRLGIVGVFGFACSFCMYEAVALTNTSLAVTMLFQYVWMGILIDCVIRKSLPSPRIIVATILVMVGTPFAAGAISGSGFTMPLAGFAWGMGAALSYAGMLVTSSRFETKLPSVVRTFYFSVTEFILAAVFSFSHLTTSLADLGAWAYALPIGLVSVVIPCLLIMKGAPQVPMGITTIMTGLELPATIVFAQIILGKMHGSLEIIGVVVICVGIVVANWDGIQEMRRQTKPV